MKNLKSQFKLIIYFFLFLSTSNITLAKNLDKFYNTKDVSNYFSGILSINDNQYEKSYTHLRSLKNLEDSHYNYSQYYQYSLVALGKFKDATDFSKKLKGKNLDNFESNLISAVYYIKNKDYVHASIYLKKIENKKEFNSIQNLISTSLNTWVNFKNITELEKGISFLDTIPESFKNIKNIQKTFAHCYFSSPNTDAMFEELTSNTNINYSRYNFFYANYLISKNNEEKTKKVIQTSLDQYPKNLILNQLKEDFEKRKLSNNKFDCKNPADVIAEILYITSNALAVQNNYMISNFYLNMAKYLNPNFVSYNALYAENFVLIQEYKKAIKIYNEMKKKGSVYSWHASKQISLILIKQKKKEDAINSLKKSFEKIVNPTIYQMFDYAEFLKNNEVYEESIKYYSSVLKLIETKSPLFAKVMDGRGVAYERTNNWQKGEKDLLSSLNAKPNNAYVINYLAYSWIEKGINIEKSLDMLRKANKLKPNDGYIIDSLGWALFKLKKYKEAKKYLEIAIQYMASDPVVNDHYADSLWMNKKTIQARYYWNYVLQLSKTEEKLKKEIEKKLLFGLIS